ncbi:hypothetical protein OG979_10440 [Actinomadura citrea]|uniref:hypothetical protein n=1 Tax=Actinomadura citrea TaxID=46158 RepID=UPI002E291A35|nr:hypothetical protein [Actinomadura citrea]
MNSAKPNNRRIQLIVLAVAAALAAAGLTFGLIKMTGSDSDGDHADPKPTATAPANEPRELILMLKHGEQHAMLDLQFHPQGGQVSGKYTLVHFDAEGKPARLPNAQQIDGSGTPSGFTLNGLGDYGPVRGNAIDGGARIHFDQTFGVEEYDWKVITSTGTFEQMVTKFESCAKKHDTAYCETVLKDVN